MKKKIIIPLSFLIILIAFFILKSNNQRSLYRTQENTRPDFRLMSMNGEEVVLSEQNSKLILVNFWETRCDFCLDQIQDLIKLDRIFLSSQLSIIGICVSSSKYGINRVISRYGVTYPVVRGPIDTRWDFNDFTETVPITYLLNSDRDIIKKYIGYVSVDIIMQDINELLR